MENQQETELTVEELIQKKEEMLQFYTESLPYLEAQEKYETLLANIDEARFKRTSIQIQYARLHQQEQEHAATAEKYKMEEENEDPVKRTLKKS
jgi:hypothetical protein